jgi:anaerobic magnesium-protoporphyrin IX monomethyl ester cyclase
MADVLLINSVIREFAFPNNPPLGVMYLASVLEAKGHNVSICDLNALRVINPDREYWLDMFIRHYDFIGLSGLIVTYAEQRRYLDFILKHYSAFGKPVLISGGGLATSAPEFTFANMPELDILVLGEGEETLLELVDQPKPLWEIAGIAYKDNDAVIKTTPRALISRLDAIPFPAWHKVPMDTYLANPIWGGQAGNSSKINYVAKRSANMIVSRGCPMSCSFCYHYVFGNKYRMRSVPNVIAEIQQLYTKYNIDFVGFVDDNTTANRGWILEFCQALIELGLPIKWGCSARVDQVDPQLLIAMKTAGCEWIGFGIESASPDILTNMNKKATPAMASNAIKMVRDAGIWANATFIAGYIGETKATLKMTADFMKDNDCLNSIFFATPYPGTELYAQALPTIVAKYGSEDRYIKSLADATDFKINLTDMADDELIELRSKAMGGTLGDEDVI